MASVDLQERDVRLPALDLILTSQGRRSPARTSSFTFILWLWLSRSADCVWSGPCGHCWQTACVTEGDLQWEALCIISCLVVLLDTVLFWRIYESVCRSLTLFWRLVPSRLVLSVCVLTKVKLNACMCVHVYEAREGMCVGGLLCLWQDFNVCLVL